MTQTVVHVARFEELDPRTAYRLWQLRESVFVVEQQCAYAELDGRDLEPGTLHVWVQDGSAPVAYLRIVEDGSGPVRIGRVLVATSARGRGLAEVMMQRALEEIGARDSVLAAQAYLADWYRKYGYQQTGPEFLDDGIPHIPMRRPG
ncbi:MAG: GNAT family N-acetyltransferase [Actinomycetes bacterium]